MSIACSECCIPMHSDSGLQADVWVCTHTGCSRYMLKVIVLKNKISENWQQDCQEQYAFWLRNNHQEACGSQDQLQRALMQRWSRSEDEIKQAMLQPVGS